VYNTVLFQWTTIEGNYAILNEFSILYDILIHHEDSVGENATFFLLLKKKKKIIWYYKLLNLKILNYNYIYVHFINFDILYIIYL